jgi:hypothetical protein
MQCTKLSDVRVVAVVSGRPVVWGEGCNEDGQEEPIEESIKESNAAFCQVIQLQEI